MHSGMAKHIFFRTTTVASILAAGHSSMAQTLEEQFQTTIAVAEERSPIFLVESGVSIGDVVRALNALGVSPRDLIAIFQAIKEAGALQARLEIM